MIKSNLSYKARSLLVLGVKRVGKSTLAERLIATHGAKLVLIFDDQGGEFARRLGAKTASTREDYIALVESGERICCYFDPAWEDPGRRQLRLDEFDWWCEFTYNVSGVVEGRVLVIIDELQDKCDAYNLPEYLDDILSKGGRREMDTCIIAQQANAIHNVGRNQISELYCFRCNDKNALEFPKSMGLEAASIRGLKDCQFIFFDCRTGEQETLDLWKN